MRPYFNVLPLLFPLALAAPVGAQQALDGFQELPSSAPPADQAAAPPEAPITPGMILAATYEGGPLPDGQSAVTFVVQVLLDRAGISPGVIDGYKGGMSESALRGFEEREGLPVDGVMDADVWALLGTATVLTDYAITEEDAANLTDRIPDNVRDKAAMKELGYTRVTERLAERFHMDEDVLQQLNPDATFSAGEVIMVADPGVPMQGEAARIEVRKGARRAAIFDAAGTMIANYPVAIGSDDTPSPVGTVEVTAVALDPTYSYNPKVNFEADGVKEFLTLPPGPNGPVGSVWIDLSKPTYGLHGTDTPAKLFQHRSHGCVRFSNWDAHELAHMVKPGVAVEFTE
ncbi:L,D-transpeptidase family protein [Sagittula salina]|uniref:Murein L,D-transpeptidase n=1 Tax=Sagittula salina TaxID=2820268 RepID=A0A940RYU6_9RHOB|nr:L,D-transpeptidase [Sagittula salina]MBP0481263.1 murein L,D-transpeptidase [Sagittula salina]